MGKSIQYVNHNGTLVPKIVGAKGKGGGTISPNSLFSSDILYLITALGEGPVYRINPNGPQDIQIQDSAIDDLINMRGNGLENTDKFFTISSAGTITQDPIPKFGDNIVSPQAFASPVILKKGNLDTVMAAEVNEATSANDWDELRFSFIINELLIAKDNGDVTPNSITYKIVIKDYLDNEELVSQTKIIEEKTDTPYKFSHRIIIPKDKPGVDYTQGYKFHITKESDDTDDTKIRDSLSVVSWDEVKHSKQAYPRTALIAYALKAVDEHTGGVPNFTSLVKGLIVKVPSNYNQPILEDGQIDWRQLEVPEDGQLLINNTLTEIGYTETGYRLQTPGTGTVLTAVNPIIYKGSWDGTFIYSWTQNPVWIIYDMLTNNTYGLGIPEGNIDKYKFYQVAMYCDACDPKTGQFIGVDAVADGTFRYKPRGLYTKIIENQLGLPKGTKVKERRFITDVTISDQERTMDIVNRITATFRGILIYAGGKVSLAVDMPDELPVMLFNETNIKQGSFQISGNKESEIITGVDVTYVEPSNHFKRETVRLDLADKYDGTAVSQVENIASLDLTGVTRRSQAMRLAQYQLAAARYQRRNIAFTTSTDAINLAPGDVISVATNGTGIAYGFGGKVVANSATGSSNTNVYLTHYTQPSITEYTFQQNTNPLALRIINTKSDRMELYIVSNTEYAIGATDNVSTGYDTITVKALSKYDINTRKISALSSGFTANLVPSVGDLWTLGEIVNTDNYYTNKSGKLFKVTGVSRDSSEQEVIVNGVEYLSNIYVDSDTFIDYEPTAYIDITSPFSVPPTPRFDFTAKSRRTVDGSIVVDGVLKITTDKLGYGQKFETEFYKANPTKSVLVSNSSGTGTVTIYTKDVTGIRNGSYGSALVGKSGFTTPIGKIKLLCTGVAPVAGDSSKLTLTVSGLSHCIDDNFNMHVLALRGTDIPGISGLDYVTLPVNEKLSSGVLKNFIAYRPTTTQITTQIESYNLVSNTIVISDSTNSTPLSDILLNTPFYLEINQTLAKDYYANNTFYVQGTSSTHVVSAALTTGVNTINLPVKPRTSADVTVYIDGKAVTNGYTLNLNASSSREANVRYTAITSDKRIRIETDYYTVPSIEVGDTVEISYGNTFQVVGTTYDSTSSIYNANRTSARIYAIKLDEVPNFSLAGYTLVNVTENPVGLISAVNNTTNSFTFTYDTDTFPGSLNLANSRIYTVHAGSKYEKLFLTDELIIPDLPTGTTSVKARSKNILGRRSAFVEKHVTVEELPIQKVENLTLTESLYKEQLAGVSVRVTCSFDHIKDQEVTDYEISYSIAANETATANFNTVKLSANGVDNDGKIRFVINNVDRGISAGTAKLTVRVTPLNRTIRGITDEQTIDVQGKTAPPKPVINFTGAQQNEVVMLMWSYLMDSENSSMLYDVDLKDVVINKLPGSVAITVDNFAIGTPVATVSANLNRVAVPIDVFGEYTYIAATRDTSGNMSDTVVGAVITSYRPARNAILAAYNEDSPAVDFTSTTNKNSSEYYFPSYANSTNGLAGPGKSAVDNANGSSSGWSVSTSADDLLALRQARYTTQIRDLGAAYTGVVYLDVAGTQVIQATYNDQHEIVANLVSNVSGAPNILISPGLGTRLALQFSQARFDSNNKTWMTGPANGNVWAIWNYGQFNNDTANTNSYALIYNLINADAIELGYSYYANGVQTPSNGLSNLTSVPSKFSLVNLKQYSDIASETYAGTPGAVVSQTFIRTSTVSPYYNANGNVNTAVFGTVNDGYVPFETGTRTMRYLQIKHEIYNSQPSKYDFTLDKFRYTIEKEKIIFDKTVTYTSANMFVDLSDAEFTSRPVISYAVLNQTNAASNPAIAVTTSASKSALYFKLTASNGTGDYPANGTANVMITAIGV